MHLDLPVWIGEISEQGVLQMSSGDQLTQVVVIVVILVAAYFGVMMWTKRVGKGGSAGGGGATAVGEDGGSSVSYDDQVPMGPDRKKDRFNLQGRDAEVAAKVLKRMLKQGQSEQGQSEQGGTK